MLTRNDPQTLSSPSVLIAADMVSPATTLTARNFSSISDCKGWGTDIRSSGSKNAPGLSGSGTSFVILPRAASSLTPHDHTYYIDCQRRYMIRDASETHSSFFVTKNRVEATCSDCHQTRALFSKFTFLHFFFDPWIFPGLLNLS